MGRTRVYFLCAVWLAAWLLVGGGMLRGETKSEQMRRKRDPLGLYLCLLYTSDAADEQ